MQCSACGGPVEWEYGAGSAVCTLCGTLEDGSQTVLESIDPNSLALTYHPAPSLKSTRTGWALSGQTGSDSRNQRNLLATAQFTRDLAQHLDAPGEAERANTLFSQAMDRGKFTWGRKAKLLSAACVAVALRETKRPHTLREISSLIHEPYVDLAHTFAEILPLFEVKLDFVEPAAHIPALHSHLASFLQGDTTHGGLARKTIVALKDLPLHAVSQTAETLADLLVRLERHKTAAAATQPTAIAVYVLALEAEMRDIFPNLTGICAILSQPFDIHKNTVLTRYSAIQDYLDILISKLDWMEPDRKEGAKAAKRRFVVRGLKDLIQFQDKLWKQEKKDGKFVLTFHDGEAVLPPNLTGKRAHLDVRKAQNALIRHGSEVGEQTVISATGKNKPLHEVLASRRPTLHLLPSFLLSSKTSSASQHVPTRLQMLTYARGGSDRVEDGELFLDGELEALIRTDKERATLAEAVDWPDSPDEEEVLKRSRKRKRPDPTTSSSAHQSHQSKRVNYDVLNALLDSVDGSKDNEEQLALAIMNPYDDDDEHSDQGSEEDEDWKRALKRHRGEVSPVMGDGEDDFA